MILEATTTEVQGTESGLDNGKYRLAVIEETPSGTPITPHERDVCAHVCWAKLATMTGFTVKIGTGNEATPDGPVTLTEMTPTVFGLTKSQTPLSPSGAGVKAEQEYPG